MYQTMRDPDTGELLGIPEHKCEFGTPTDGNITMPLCIHCGQPAEYEKHVTEVEPTPAEG